MVEISASILTVEKGREAETFLTLEKSKIDYFHIDVMDGKFVMKDTYHEMVEYSSYLKRISNLPMDIHLMVEDVKTAIEVFSTVEPNIITFHLEACKDKEQVMENIKLIKERGARVGIAVKPETNIEEVYEYLPYIHTCLVMTVEPGKGGQKLIPETIQKVEKIKEYIENNNIDIDVEVDGGINLENKEELKKAGANILVIGSCIINSNDYKERIETIKK